MIKSLIGLAIAVLVLGVACLAGAKDEAIKIGSTREEVIAAYGKPTGTVSSADEEIFTYSQGMISLKNGSVVYIDPDWGKRPAQPAAVPQAKPEKKKSIMEWLGGDKSSSSAATAEDVKIFANQGRQIDLATVLEPGKITVVDFYADWCGPCRRIAPELERLAASDPDVVLRKVDIVNWETPVVRQYNIRSVPNIRVYDRNGTMVGSPTPSLQEVKNNIARAKKSG